MAQHSPTRPAALRPPGFRAGWLGTVQAKTAAAIERLFGVRWVWSLIFLAALAPLMVGPGTGPALPVPDVGSMATTDVLAPAAVEFVDQAATRDVREVASATVLPIFDYDSRALNQATAAVHRIFEAGRRGLELAARQHPDGPESKRGPGHALRDDLEVQAPPETLAYLAEARFDPAIEARLDRALGEVFRHHVGGGKSILPRSGRGTLRDTVSGREWKVERLEDLLPLDQARRVALGALREAGAGPTQRAALEPLIADLVAPNLVANNALTEARRQEA